MGNKKDHGHGIVDPGFGVGGVGGGSLGKGGPGVVDPGFGRPAVDVGGPGLVGGGNGKLLSA